MDVHNENNNALSSIAKLRSAHSMRKAEEKKHGGSKHNNNGSNFQYMTGIHCRIAVWPWELKHSREHFIGKFVPDYKQMQTFTNREKDGLKRYLLSCLIAWSNFSFLMAVLSIGCFIIGNELFYAYLGHPYQDMCFPISGDMPDEVDPSIPRIIILLQVVLTLLTVVLVFARVQYYKARYHRRVLSGTILAGVSFLQSDLSPIFFLDVAFMAFHCPPGVEGCIQVTQLVGAAAPPLSYHAQMFSITCLARIILIIPLVIHGSRFETESSRQIIKLHAVVRSHIIGFRDVLWRYPALIVVATYFFAIFYFAYIMMCFERSANFEAHFTPPALDAYWMPTYTTCLWFCWAVQSTVGLGDWYPLTYAGRVIAVSSNIMGMITAAMLISAVISKFKLTSEEQRVRHSIDWISSKRKLPVYAASLIALWYRSCMDVGWRPAYSSALLKFRQLRKMLKDQHPADDMAPMREMLNSVRYLVDSQYHIREELNAIKSTVNHLSLSMGGKVEGGVRIMNDSLPLLSSRTKPEELSRMERLASAREMINTSRSLLVSPVEDDVRRRRGPEEEKQQQILTNRSTLTMNSFNGNNNNNINNVVSNVGNNTQRTPLPTNRSSSFVTPAPNANQQNQQQQQQPIRPMSTSQVPRPPPNNNNGNNNITNTRPMSTPAAFRDYNNNNNRRRRSFDDQEDDFEEEEESVRNYSDTEISVDTRGNRRHMNNNNNNNNGRRSKRVFSDADTFTTFHDNDSRYYHPRGDEGDSYDGSDYDDDQSYRYSQPPNGTKQSAGWT